MMKIFIYTPQNYIAKRHWLTRNFPTFGVLHWKVSIKAIDPITSRTKSTHKKLETEKKFYTLFDEKVEM